MDRREGLPRKPSAVRTARAVLLLTAAVVVVLYATGPLLIRDIGSSDGFLGRASWASWFDLPWGIVITWIVIAIGHVLMAQYVAIGGRTARNVITAFEALMLTAGLFAVAVAILPVALVYAVLTGNLVAAVWIALVIAPFLITPPAVLRLIHSPAARPHFSPPENKPGQMRQGGAGG